MLKIKYPLLAPELTDFHKSYVDILNYSSVKVKRIDKLLAKVLWKKKQLSFEILITAEFNDLLEIKRSVEKVMINKELSKLAKLFDYNASQPAISKFFMMQRWINFSSCYYCNMDNIYAFSDMDDYRDTMDFIQRASEHDLMQVPGLGEKTAKKIIDARAVKPFSDVKDLPVNRSLMTVIQKFDIKNNYNHFTLDHFHHKAINRILSLCLYNLVPSCYACNSKFKGQAKLSDPDKAYLVSPSSYSFSFREDVMFSLLFYKRVDKIADLKDFSMNLDIKVNNSVHGEFLKIFKISGRYMHHKAEVLELIKMKKKYPDSMIKELAIAAGQSVEQIRKDIFGAELYEEAYDNKSLTKFKRDIAKNIGIPGLLRN